MPPARLCAGTGLQGLDESIRAALAVRVDGTVAFGAEGLSESEIWDIFTFWGVGIIWI